MNYFSSPVTKAVTSSLRQSSVRLDKTWNPLQDHNYAATPIDDARITVNCSYATAQSSNSNSHGDALLKIKSQQEIIRNQSSQLEKCKEEINKRNSQLVETAGIMIDYQKVRKKLISTEMDVENQKSLVEEARTEKAETENRLKKFRNSATNLCCGVSVFIEEFRRQFISWCVTNEVQEKDKKLFRDGLDCISGFVEDKLQTWLRDGFLTHGDLEEAKNMIESLAVTKESKSWEEEEEAKTVSVTSTSSDETLPFSSVEEELDSTRDLNTLPDVTEKAIQVMKEDSPAEKKHAINLTVAREEFLCICGAQCRNMSGLKLHVLQSNKIPNKATPLNSSKKAARKSGKRLGKSTPKVEIKSEPVTFTSRVENTPPTEPEEFASDDDEVIFMGTNNLDIKPIIHSTPSAISVTPRPRGRPPMSKVALSFAPKSLQASTSTAVVKCEKIKVEETKLIRESKSITSKKSGSKPLVSRSSHKVHPTKPLQCCCGYKASRPYILNRHIRYYKEDRNFACKICPKLFVNNSYLNQHYRNSHKMKQPPTTVDVKKLKETSSNSSAKTETSKPAYAAAAIRARFMSKKRRSAGKRKRKLLRITAKERISCQNCYRRFPHIRDLIKHMSRRLHGGEGFASRSSYYRKKASSSKENAQNVESESTPRRSSRIHTASTTKSTMSLYYNSTKNSGSSSTADVQQQEQRCECSRSCDKRSRKRRAPPHCTICGFIFVCVVHLENHMLEKHTELKKEKTEIDCKKCGATFETEREFTRHSKYKRCRSSDSEEIAPKKAKLSSSSPNVKKVTTSKQNHEDVSINHRQVQVKGSLSVFKCSCGKSYASKRVLLKHVQEQRYGRIFKCSFCGHGFAKHFNLKQHVRRKHNVEFSEQDVFGCGTCGKTFKTNSERFHHRKEHNDDQVPGKK